MKISVIGTGYVGLVSGACLAAKGHQVTCVDLDENKVEAINSGHSPIHEDGLPELLKLTIGNQLKASTDLESAVANTDLSLVAVGTPFDGDEIDLSFVRAVAESIGRALRNKTSYHTVVVKSTVVPGTTEDVVLPILEGSSGKLAGRDFGVGMNPEFLREGCAVSDFMNPDRIVLGGIDDRSVESLREVYSVFPGVDILATNPRTAEMIKYTANGLLATMISFSNEIANLSSRVGGIDASEVMRGVHLDRRLSPILDGTRIQPGFTSYLEAGCGFGGSCFPKDVKALVAHGSKHGMEMKILSSVMEVNERQPLTMIELLKRHFPSLTGLNVAVLGLAFKPGTSDIRESPAIPILRQLLQEKANVTAFDPVAKAEMKTLFGDDVVTYCDSLAETVRGVAAVLLITRWNEFESLPDLLEPNTLLVDGRRMLSKTRIPVYEGIGLSS